MENIIKNYLIENDVMVGKNGRRTSIEIIDMSLVDLSKLFMNAVSLCISNKNVPIKDNKESDEEKNKIKDTRQLPSNYIIVEYLDSPQKDDDITKVSELPERSESDINKLRDKIRRRVMKQLDIEDGFPTITSEMIAEFIAYYDAYFFNRLIETNLEENNLEIVSIASNTLRTTAGTAGRIGDYLAVSISTKVMEGVKSDNSHRLLANKQTPVKDRLDALMNIIEHELIHILAMLDKDANTVNVGGVIEASEVHGDWFKRYARKIFGHTEYKHNLIDYQGSNSPELKKTTKERLSVGQKIYFFDKSGQKITGTINKLNPVNARVLIGVGREYNVPYSLLLVES